MTFDNLAAKGFYFYFSKIRIHSDLATFIVGLFCSSNDICEVLLHSKVRFTNILFWKKNPSKVGQGLMKVVWII